MTPQPNPIHKKRSFCLKDQDSQRQLFENLSPYIRTTFKKGLPLLIHWRLDEDINFHHFKCLSNSIRRKRVSPLQASCPSINLFSRCVKVLVKVVLIENNKKLQNMLLINFVLFSGKLFLSGDHNSNFPSVYPL